MTTERPENAILNELNAAAKDYDEAKESFDTAHIRFEVAKRRLEATKQLGSEVMTTHDWDGWLDSHSSVAYAGMSIGEAATDFILTETRDFYRSCGPDEDEIGTPIYKLDAIRHGLLRGGFEFRTLAPAREIHAGLIKAVEVERPKGKDFYIAVGAEEIANEEFQRRRLDSERD